jgi:hypothetical protein
LSDYFDFKNKQLLVSRDTLNLPSLNGSTAMITSLPPQTASQLEQQRQQTEQLTERLKAMGIDPDQI